MIELWIAGTFLLASFSCLVVPLLGSYLNQSGSSYKDDWLTGHMFLFVVFCIAFFVFAAVWSIGILVQYFS